MLVTSQDVQGPRQLRGDVAPGPGESEPGVLFRLEVSEQKGKLLRGSVRGDGPTDDWERFDER